MTLPAVAVHFFKRTPSRPLRSQAILTALAIKGYFAVTAVAAATTVFMGSAQAENSQWTSFSDGRVSFSYPTSWQKKPTGDDKDCICKVGARDGIIELSLSRGTGGGASPATMAQMLQETVLAKQPQFKEISTKVFHFGPQGKQEGTLKEVTFQVGGMAVEQKFLLFKVGDEIYTLIKTCRLEESRSQENFWAQVTGSMTIGNRSGAVAKSNNAGTTKSSPQLQPVKSAPWKVFTNEKTLRFSYPSDFKDNESDSPEHPASLSESDGSTHFAAINVYCADIHPAETLNHVAALIEEKHLAVQKNYRALHEESRTSGKNGNLDMTVKESTFDNKEGRNIKQLAAFFRSGDKLWVLTVGTWGWTANETNGLFSKIAASVELLN